MENHEEPFEIEELDDQALGDVAGGAEGNAGCTNTDCGGSTNTAACSNTRCGITPR